MSLVTPPILFLQDHNISFELFQHKSQITSLEQAAEERSQTPNQIVRTILFRCPKNQFVIVLMPGEMRVSWPALRQYIGQSRITMASEKEVFEVTGYKPGAVSPFSLPRPIRILVDRTILEKDVISLGSGLRGLAIIMTTKNLLTALKKYELVSLAD